MEFVKQRYLRIFFLLACILPAIGHSQNIIGYYSGNEKQLEKYSVQGITHLVFSFCHLQGSRLSVTRRDTLTIQAMVRLKKKSPAMKIILSLGGWGGCETCATVFSTDSGRAVFAESVVEMLGYFQADGIDIDWEFPTLGGFPGHPFYVQDKLHLTLLVALLRDRLGWGREISVVSAGFSPYLEGSIDLVAVTKYADRIHLMTYDLIGSNNHVSGHASALYSTPWQLASADYAVRYCDSLKLPMNKIAIGVAFYGRTYQLKDKPAQGLQQPAEFTQFVTMRVIRKKYTAKHGFGTYWDNTAKAPYKYNPSTGVYLTYDDERSIAAKCAYVKIKKLNGILFWELRLDEPSGGLLGALEAGFKN